MQLRLIVLVTAGLSVCSCRKVANTPAEGRQLKIDRSAPSAPIAGGSDAGHPAPLRESTTAVPQGFTGGLSVLQTDGPLTRWFHVHLPDAERHEVASFAASCESVVFSGDARHALVTCDDGYRSVDLTSGHIAALSMAPGRGHVEAAGFDWLNRPMVLVFDEATKPAADGYFHVYGQKLKAETRFGIPCLAHAFLWGSDERWQHVESAVSNTDTDDSDGTSVLNAAADLWQERDADPDAPAVEAHDLLKRLKPFEASLDERDRYSACGWISLQTHPAAYLFETSNEGRCYATSALVFTNGRRLRAAPGIPEHDPAIRDRDPFIIVTGDSTPSAIVYDVRARDAVFRGDNIRFWPDHVERPPAGPGEK